MSKINIDSYNVLIFDCDGVILNSNNFKNQIFLKAVKEYPQKKKKLFENYIKKNKGLSRYKFFEYFFKKIIKLNNKNEYVIAYNKSLKYYNLEVKKNYLKCKLVPGILKFLKKNQNIEKYILSGSNQAELKKIFKEKKINIFFKKIYGSPITKVANANKLNLSLNINSKKLYFGDSYYDYIVAKKIGCDFVFISDYSDDKKLYKIKKIFKFKDFTSL